MVICNGLILAPSIGVLDWLMIGFTTLFTAEIPLLIAGVVSIPISRGMVSALGIKLNALSMENGQIRRTATMPQSRTLTHFGAFLNKNLKASTTSTSQLAEILMLMIFRKSSDMVSLPSGCGRSCAVLRPVPPQKFSDAW